MVANPVTVPAFGGDTSPMPADPLKVKDFWLDVVRPAADLGKLEKIPTKIARTPREKAQAQTQNHWLTRKTFGGFGENYDAIDWSKRAVRLDNSCGCGDAA